MIQLTENHSSKTKCLQTSNEWPDKEVTYGELKIQKKTVASTNMFWSFFHPLTLRKNSKLKIKHLRTKISIPNNCTFLQFF